MSERMKKKYELVANSYSLQENGELKFIRGKTTHFLAEYDLEAIVFMEKKAKNYNALDITHQRYGEVYVFDLYDNDQNKIFTHEIKNTNLKNTENKTIKKEPVEIKELSKSEEIVSRLKKLISEKEQSREIICPDELRNLFVEKIKLKISINFYNLGGKLYLVFGDNEQWAISRDDHCLQFYPQFDINPDKSTSWIWKEALVEINRLGGFDPNNEFF